MSYFKSIVALGLAVFSPEIESEHASLDASKIIPLYPKEVSSLGVTETRDRLAETGRA
jgi:hypothetical protein